MKINVLGSQSGSVGPYVTARNKAGTYTRARVIPLNPQSPAQQNIRATLAAVASMWRGLPQETREAWAGVQKQVDASLSPFNVFARVVCNLVLSGQDPATAAPVVPAFGILTMDGIAASVAGTPLALTLTVTDLATTTTGAKYKVEASAPCSAGRHVPGNAFKVIGYFNDAASITTGVAAAYAAEFGVPAAGTRMAVRITEILSGFQGVPHSGDCLVTAGLT